MKPHKWSYLREQINQSNSSKQQPGIFKITSAIERPRDAFMWILNDVRNGSQTQNPFLFDTFNVADDPGKKLVSCQLEVSNGNKYPENEYVPDTQMARLFRDVHKYSYTENEYQGGGTLLNRGNFGSLFIYFDLRNQKLDIEDGATKLTFNYKLSGATTKDYTIYALIFYEKDVELYNTTGKLLIR